MFPPARPRPRTRAPGRPIALVVAMIVAVALAGCEAGPEEATPPPRPGTSDAPRDVNLITKDDLFVPRIVDLVPGETVVLHVVNGGLDAHEAVIGNADVQAAWEVAEAATVGSPPGPTPVVSVPPAVAGLRVTVRSGERVDILWVVPADAAAVRDLLIGCHVPGHWARGMRAVVRIPGDTVPATPPPSGE